MADGLVVGAVVDLPLPAPGLAVAVALVQSLSMCRPPHHRQGLIHQPSTSLLLVAVQPCPCSCPLVDSASSSARPTSSGLLKPSSPRDEGEDSCPHDVVVVCEIAVGDAEVVLHRSGRTHRHHATLHLVRHSS
eukprot:4671939-Heterocapsa_arctica.AAC.1